MFQATADYKIFNKLHLLAKYKLADFLPPFQKCQKLKCAILEYSRGWTSEHLPPFPTQTYTHTCFAMSLEHVNIHEVLQVFGKRVPSQAGELVRTLDALGLPVSPVQHVFMDSEAKGVRQLTANQNLHGMRVED